MSDFEQLCMGKGPQFAVHSISFVPELSPADSDQVMVPDLDAVYICPWDKSMAIIFADLFWEDKPYNVCPRQALKRVIRERREGGLYRLWPASNQNSSPCVGTTTASRSRHSTTTHSMDCAHGARPLATTLNTSLDSMGFLGEMIDILEDIGWNLHDVVAEGAYSQFELDFHYTNVLEMADRLVFLRILLKEVAKKHGMFITFMPKPTTGDWRSGAHMNVSMQKVDNPA